jgi:hypothetical protein
VRITFTILAKHDDFRAVRRLLKRLLRCYGLRCVAIRFYERIGIDLDRGRQVHERIAAGERVFYAPDFRQTDGQDVKAWREVLRKRRKKQLVERVIRIFKRGEQCLQS